MFLGFFFFAVSIHTLLQMETTNNQTKESGKPPPPQKSERVERVGGWVWPINPIASAWSCDVDADRTKKVRSNGFRCLIISLCLCVCVCVCVCVFHHEPLVGVCARVGVPWSMINFVDQWDLDRARSKWKANHVLIGIDF